MARCCAWLAVERQAARYLLARRARRVLAADLDANPGLAYTLGLGATEAGLPDEPPDV